MEVIVHSVVNMAADQTDDTLVRIEFNFMITLKNEQLSVIHAICEQNDGLLSCRLVLGSQ